MYWLVRRGWSPRLIGTTVVLGVVGKVLPLPVKQMRSEMLGIILTGHGGFASGMEKR